MKLRRLREKYIQAKTEEEKQVILNKARKIAPHISIDEAVKSVQQFNPK